MRVAAVIAVAAAMSFAAGATGPATATPGTSHRATSNALSVLRTFPVAAETPAGYARSKFSHWQTINGCDTRSRVLTAESRIAVTKNSNCTVQSGRWFSPYDGLTFTTASRMDVDHLVPLAEAWRSGAGTWAAATRKQFANDVGYSGSLIAVSLSSNRSKSDRDPASWMPRAQYRCVYAKTWVAVKFRWRLAVNAAEKAALTASLNACPNRGVALPARAR